MRTFKVSLLGNVPETIKMWIPEAITPATPNNIKMLDENIDWIVGSGEAYGQLNKIAKMASLWGKNGSKEWAVDIEW